MTTAKSIVNMSFEEALSELEEIVKKIDAGQQELESAIKSFERGVLLKKHCEEKLNSAKLKIEQITKNADGGFETQEVIL